MSVKDDACYLCGKTGPMTREHVIGRCFFVRPYPDPMWTLPAHYECNRSVELDEEWMANTYAVVHPDGQRMQRRYEKAIRSLKRDEAQRYKEAFMRSFKPLGDAGMLTQIPGERVGHVLAKIVKGLAWERAQLFLGDDYGWNWIQVAPVEVEEVEVGPEQILQLHDTLFAKWATLEGGDLVACWMAFNWAFCHFVVAIRKQSPSAPADVPLFDLTWPKPPKAK